MYTKSEYEKHVMEIKTKNSIHINVKHVPFLDATYDL